MPIVMNMQWDGVTAEQYEQVRKLVNWEAQRATGGLLHVACFNAKGLLVTDVWESAEDFNRFVETRLSAGVQKAGITSQPRVEIAPLHALFNPGVDRV